MRKSRPGLLIALIVIFILVGVAWKFFETDRCLDAGGMVVGSFMRDQHCVMPNPATNPDTSSRP